MDAARTLFHDKERSQFIIVTIPTLMAAAESARLAASLRQEGIPLETMVVNQVRVLGGAVVSDVVGVFGLKWAETQCEVMARGQRMLAFGAESSSVACLPAFNNQS